MACAVRGARRRSPTSTGGQADWGRALFGERDGREGHVRLSEVSRRCDDVEPWSGGSIGKTGGRGREMQLFIPGWSLIAVGLRRTRAGPARCSLYSEDGP